MHAQHFSPISATKDSWIMNCRLQLFARFSWNWLEPAEFFFSLSSHQTSTMVFFIFRICKITYRLCSSPTESIWPIDKHGTDCDVFCPLDNGLLVRPLLYTYKSDCDECCAWRSPNNRHNCKCHSVCRSFDRRTLCMVCPRVDHLPSKRNEYNLYLELWIKHGENLFHTKY